MAPKVDPKKAPAGASSPTSPSNAAGNNGAASAVDHHALEERRIADARSAFAAEWEGESIAEDLARVLVERSSDLFIEVTYDRLAMDYVVMGLWDSMTTAVARANVQPDGAPSIRHAPRSLSPLAPPVSSNRPTPKHGDNAANLAPLALTGSANLVQQSSTGSVSSVVSTASTSHVGVARKGGKTPRAVKINAANNSSSSSNANQDQEVKSPATMAAVPSPEDPSIQLGAPPLHVERPAPTWAADAPPTQIPCDLHTRHNIALRRKPSITSQDSAPSLSRDDRPSSQRRRRRQPASTDGSQPTNQSFMAALSDAGSRPHSRNSSLNSALANTQRPGNLVAARRKSRSVVDGLFTPNVAAASADKLPLPGPLQDVAAAATTASDATPVLTAEEQHILAEVAAAEQRKQNALRTNQVITSALSDTKVTEKGFVVDGLAGRVVSLVPPEEMLQSAKKLAEPLRFIVPDHGSAQQSPAQLNISTASPGRVSTAPQPKPKAASTLRREENFFIPDLTAVAMVQPVTPVGGVSVKDTEGAPRSAELRVPKNKMTRQEFVTALKSQNAGGTGTPSDSGLEGGATAPPLKLGNPPAPQTARAPAQPNVAKTDPALASITPRPPAVSDPIGGKGATTLPKARNPPPAPPSSAPLSVARRLPMTPGTASSPSRKAQARSVADKAAAMAKKPTVVANSATTKEFLSDDFGSA